MSKSAASSKSAVPQGISPQASTNTLTIANDTRNQAIKEILATEESYTASLGNIVQVRSADVWSLYNTRPQLYLQPLTQMVTSGKPLLNQNEIKVIFGQVEMLYRFHVDFLKEISPVIKNWNNKACIGDIFHKNVRFSL